MQIRLLGPLEIERDHSLVAVGGPRLRRLLVALATPTGATRSIDSLIDIVWTGAIPPQQARRTIMSYISRLRGSLPDGSLQFTEQGYRLVTDRVSVDIDDFAQLVATGRRAMRAGDTEGAMEALDAALALWRGEPMSEFDGEIWAQSEQARLRELRLIAVVGRFETMLALHRADEVAAEIETESARDPFHAELHHLHVRALCLCGRQVEALRRVHRIRLDLAEIGLAPPSDLADLEQRILVNDPSVLTYRRADDGDHPTTLHLGREDRAALAASSRPSTLIGRQAVSQRLADALDRSRVVTVVGIGGIGKTSLLCDVLERRSDAGVQAHEVQLATLRSCPEILAAIASSYELVVVPTSPGELALALAHHDDTLLALDNCEHVVDIVAEIVAALAQCDRLAVATTSRIPLGLVGETLVRLGPLSTADATQLFIRAARQRQPDFEPTDDERHVIGRIAERCDRIPLALELAAAHASVFDVATILERLDRVLVSRERRPSVARHRTMNAAIDWSIDLLDGDLARSLGALTVFAGSFDTAAAEAVVELVTPEPVEQILASLAAQSLIECHEGVARNRFRLLEPVRQRALARLVTDEAVIRHRHLDHYLAVLEAAYELLGTTSSQPMLDLIRDDLANLAAVHSWALDSGRVRDDMRLYRPLTPFILWHELLPPRQWALETMHVPGAKKLDEYHATVMAAAIGHFDGPENQEFQEEVDRFYGIARARSGANPGTDPAFRAAVWLDSLTGDRRRANQNWELVDLSDPHTHFLYYFIGSFARALSAEDIAGAARSHLAEGVAWARSIGAENFVIALLTTLSEFEVVFGDPQVGYEIAVDTELRASAIGMRFVEAESIRCQALASLHGAATLRSPVSQFREILTSALRRRCGARAVFALAGVSYLFARLGYDDAAALASHIEDQTYDLRLDDLDRLSDETRQRAARRVEAGMDVFAIVREAIGVLDLIEASTVHGR